MNFYIVEQTPILTPRPTDERCPWGNETLLDWIVDRVVELSYTAHDLAPFADDLGYSGPPFRWDAERRPILQAELDALFFHLYGLDRDEVDWVLGTFTVLRKYEERDHGEFRTRRLVLDHYDAMAAAIAAGQQYVTPLDPPPADPSTRHPM